MRSTAANVSTYIEEQPDRWQSALRKLRALCRRELKGYKEGMAYGMPSYSRDGRTEIGFGSQARYLSLYVLKQPVLDAHRAELVLLGRRVFGRCDRFQAAVRRRALVTYSVMVRSMVARARRTSMGAGGRSASRRGASSRRWSLV